MKKIKSFIKKTLFLTTVIYNQKNEPFFDFKFLIKHIFNNALYDTNGVIINKDIKINYQEDKDGIWLGNNEIKILYPKSLGVGKAIRNFESVILEQSVGHPHRYNYELIKKNWVIYDIGTAEGYQVYEWLKKTNKIILFEPDIEFYDCLNKTFNKEIKEGKIILLNYGIGKREPSSGGKTLNLESLQFLINKFKLPQPDYIKADIEGYELFLIKSMQSLLMSKVIKMIEITTYHRPNDYKKIRNYLSEYGGVYFFSKGHIILNINGWDRIGNYNKLYHPIIRKVLYSHIFN